MKAKLIKIGKQRYGKYNLLSLKPNSIDKFLVKFMMNICKRKS
jgi:hypothetical protein